MSKPKTTKKANPKTRKAVPTRTDHPRPRAEGRAAGATGSRPPPAARGIDGRPALPLDPGHTNRIDASHAPTGAPRASIPTSPAQGGG